MVRRVTIAPRASVQSMRRRSRDERCARDTDRTQRRVRLCRSPTPSHHLLWNSLDEFTEGS
jgi:hypothetical protein